VETRCHQIKKSAGRQVDKDHYLAANDIEESRIKHDLDKSAREEQQAADQYRDRGKYASGAGDRKTSELYEHVAGEEDQHKKEFQDRGQQLSAERPGNENAPYTTVHDRFQITCSYCGLLATETKLANALERAKSLQKKHSSKDEKVEVFDVMAKVGACELWDPEGHCLAYKKQSQLPQVFGEGSKVLPFSDISGDVITWRGFFPEQSLSVQVKGAVTTPKTVLETVLKQSKAVVRNIVPDKEIAFSCAWDDKVSWLSSLQFPKGKGMDVKTVEVVVYDIEGLSQPALEDIFKDSLAVIGQKEVAGSMAPQTKKYWVIVEKPGGSYFTEGSAVPYEEFEEERKKILDRGGELPTIRIRFEEPSGNGNGDKELPATVQGEPIPDKYRELTPFIDEPLPPGTDYLVPAVVPEEGERKIDAVLRQLKDGVESIQGSSQFRLFLTTMSKFHDYSIGNLILIAIQKPEASKVAGFQTWKNLGRWVKKGASGIAILAPVMPPKPKKEEREDEEEEVLMAPVNYKVVHVFDIGQTEGKPLPEFDVPVLTGEVNEELFAKALALAKAQGLDVSFESRPHQDPGIKGQYFGKSIWVKSDEPRAQQLKSLLHEMAHYYSEGVLRIPKRDAETIAESAAYATGSHFGFDSGTRSFPYVALWAQDKKVLQANLASIRKVTTVLLEGLEKAPGTEEKLVPALKPFEPYHFAEYVLRYNRFSDAEIPIYSGLTGRNPLRVPDHIWSEVIAETEGEFVKQGELNVFHIPEKERPAYMRAAPTWRDVASTIPTKPCPKCGKPMKLRYFSKTKEYSWGHEYSMSDIMSDKSICDYSEKAKPDEVSSVISTKPSTPSPREEMEFIADSPELIPFTINDIGYRDKLDNAFEAAIARAKGG